MALPFYIIEAQAAGTPATSVASLLAAQTAGALLSNPLCGWWGDRFGKRELLQATAALAAAPALLALAASLSRPAAADVTLAWFAAVFVLLGASGNGGTIAQLGYLMEISPDDDRPAYSGYFNALVAPAALLPLAGAVLIEVAGSPVLFAVSAVAAGLQCVLVRQLRQWKE